MKVFVLILFTSWGHSPMGITHEFNGEAACLNAGQQFAKRWGASSVYYVCVPKDAQ